MGIDRQGDLGQVLLLLGLRTDNCVKNRFYSRFRRSIRSVNEFIKLFWKKTFKQLKPNFISKVIEMI